MKKMLPVTELARDERFVRVSIMDGVADPRSVENREEGKGRRGPQKLTPDRAEAPDAARSLMHGIFMGEIQALEGAGRTCWDFDTGPGREEAPFELKLDMARQCWDEARHVEISVKLTEHMGSCLLYTSPSPRD